ncbi:MAG: hypothetical protein DMG59_29110 [Acidobacteria bacterium]|nr:MAG: hypothetical protein DMG59_29110 [Acidobacteriota bacterium]
MMRRGDHLLSATRLADLDLVSYQYPYYLYTLNRSGANPRPLYTIDITEELAYGWPLGSPPEQQAYKMLGQPENLPAGYYRATLDVTADKGARLIAEVVGRNSNKIAARLEGSADDIRELEFSTRGDTPLQFRLGGPGLVHGAFSPMFAPSHLVHLHFTASSVDSSSSMVSKLLISPHSLSFAVFLRQVYSASVLRFQIFSS